MKQGTITAQCRALNTDDSVYFDVTLELTWKYLVDPGASGQESNDAFYQDGEGAVEFSIDVILAGSRKTLERGIKNVGSSYSSRGAVQNDFLRWLRHFS